MAKLPKACLLALILFFTCTIARSQSQQPAAQPPDTKTEPPTSRIPRVTRPPKLEDYLDGKSRDEELRITDFRQREPQDGTPVSQPTTAYLSYDDKNFYAIFVCKDDPDKIRARMAKREDIFSDDVVGLFLDTFHDKQRSYTFICNPRGIQLDGTTTEGQEDDFSFDTLWYSEGKLTSDGYVVWMAIPFKSIRFDSSSVQEWGIALGRIIPRNNEEAFWPYITEREDTFIPQFATLQGIENISPGRNIQIIPYGFFARARFLDDEQNRFNTETDTRAGVDAKIVLRDAFTLDITVNPDFSQVESDEPQVTVNQRFEVFFPEKRPFFLENAGFFQTANSLFFSRRIADPQFGVRLTGKTGPWAIAGLVIDDRAPGKLLPVDDPLRDERAVIGVGRVRREFAEQSSLGVLVTSRDFGGSSNRVYSLDTRIKLSPNLTFEGEAVSSDTRLFDGTHLSGPAYFAGLFYNDRHFSNSTTYLDRSPDFRTQVGFVPRVDIRNLTNFATYRWRPKKGSIQSFGPNLFTEINWDRRGRVQDWRVNMPFSISWKGQTDLFIRRSEFFTLFQDREFRQHGHTVEFSTARLKWLEFDVAINHGTDINFFPTEGIDPFLANFFDGELEIVFRPNSQLRLEQTYIYSRLGLRAESAPPGESETGSIFTNHIFRSKLNYQFNRELSIRAILDYESVLPNTALIPLDRSKNLGFDILATYLVNPGTALYVGYTDGYENLRLDNNVPPNLIRTSRPTTSIGRQFFVKMSYLLRF